MGVNEAGDDPFATDIDHMGPVRHGDRVRATDRGDALAFDEHYGVGQRFGAGAVDDRSADQGGHFGAGVGRRDGKRRYERTERRANAPQRRRCEAAADGAKIHSESPRRGPEPRRTDLIFQSSPPGCGAPASR